MKWVRRFVTLLEIVAAVNAIVLTVQACNGPVPRITQVVVPAVMAAWVVDASVQRHRAARWPVKAHWERFWRHHEQAIPDSSPIVPGVVYPPDDH